MTPDDPQSNGFAENFVKQMCKLVHTAVAEKKDPRVEVHNYLLHYIKLLISILYCKYFLFNRQKAIIQNKHMTDNYIAMELVSSIL